MRLTYKLSADSLDSIMLEDIKSHFRGRDINIIVEDFDSPFGEGQIETFKEMEKLRQTLTTLQVDQSIDLSAMANEINT